jgi:hypothetical protein
MRQRGAHERRRPLWTGREHLNFVDVLLAAGAEMLILMYLVVALLAAR